MHSAPAVVVGLVWDSPGGPPAEAAGAAEELGALLAASHPAVRWSVGCVADAAPPEDGAPVADAGRLLTRGRAALLAHDLDVAVVVTDRPLRLRDRPVAAHASPVQQSIVIAAPAVPEGVAAAAARLVPALLETEEGDASATRVLTELAADDDVRHEGLAFVVRTLLGSIRVLVGMVHANRPWLHAVRLSRTLVGAFAAAAIAIVTPDVWLLADRMQPLRLGTIALLVLLATVLVLVIGGGLRERAPSRRVRRTVLIHNTAVWVSVSLGVVTMYAGLVLASLAVTLLVLPWGLVAQTVSHPVGWGTMLRVGALASVVALVGSAFGAGLEEDAAVQRATYTG
ncbi:MAG: hypothetical protein ACXVW2_13215, partial [Nocardioidaceae bacterium]